jgi:NTP pyrophosphatase (non-canonical NTP hydrolase)
MNDKVTEAAVSLEKVLGVVDPRCEMTQCDSVFNALYGIGNAQAICHGLAAHSGWWLDTETGEDVREWPQKFVKLWVMSKLALVHSEVSEGVEGYRKGKMDDHLPHRDMLEVELADAVIRILDLAGGFGMDIAGAMIEKLAYNQQRADHKVENRVAEGGKSV